MNIKVEKECMFIFLFTYTYIPNKVIGVNFIFVIFHHTIPHYQNLGRVAPCFSESNLQLEGNWIEGKQFYTQVFENKITAHNTWD